MSLRQQVQQAVQAGMRAMDDIPESSGYASVGTPSYAPSTGVITATPTTYPNVPVVFTNFSRMEIDGQAIRAEDQKAIIATRDLTAVPTINDMITRTDGTVWSVIAIRVDPAGAAWVLHVRKP